MISFANITMHPEAIAPGRKADERSGRDLGDYLDRFRKRCRVCRAEVVVGERQRVDAKRREFAEEVA